MLMTTMSLINRLVPSSSSFYHCCWRWCFILCLIIPVTGANHCNYNDDGDDDWDDDHIADQHETWWAIRRSLDQWRLRTKTPTSGLTGNNRKKREQVSVCYDGFGCFRDQGPFDYLDTLPASPESIGTTFTLYTRRNGADGEPLFYDGQISSVSAATTANNNNSTVATPTSGSSSSGSISGSSFNATNDIKIIIHGFGSSSKRPWVVQMTEVLLGLDDFNVINVDWQNGSKLPNYVQAAANTQLVGKQIAKLIESIDRRYQVSPSRYHLIGFSLGAHVAGFTGQQVANISRITGLDPASPLFEGYDPDVRLDPTDARFVDVIHSNGDSFFRGGFGFYEPMGAVDFYPNGGRVQLGCSTTLGAITNMLYHGRQWNLLCNHRRAFRFFIDSVQPHCTFRAFACASYDEYLRGQCFACGPRGQQCSNMGYYSNLSQGRGAMYLMTRDKEPFCVNQFRVQIRFGAKQGVTWGSIQLQLADTRRGLNESFTLTQEVDQLRESQRFQTLIVAHPQLDNLTELTLTYTRYRGWIYHGKNEWIIDRVELLDSNFVIKTYCQPGTMLADTIPVRIPLHAANCTLGPGFEDAAADLSPIDSMAETPTPEPESDPIHFRPSTAPHRYYYHQQQHPVADPGGRFVRLPMSGGESPPPQSDQTPPVGIELLERRRPVRLMSDPPSAGASTTQQQVQSRVRTEQLATSSGSTIYLTSDMDQQQQQNRNQSPSGNEAGIITPILSTASKMFWRLWNGNGGNQTETNEKPPDNTGTGGAATGTSPITGTGTTGVVIATPSVGGGTRQGRWLPPPPLGSDDDHRERRNRIIHHHHRIVLVVPVQSPPVPHATTTTTATTSHTTWNGRPGLVVGYPPRPPLPPPPSPRITNVA